MGVESDRLVFDYLSRVGDLAQTALPSAERMQLVARLRDDIDRRRGGSDSPATVRRILGRIGTPDQVVEAAAGSGPGSGVPGTGPGAGPGGGSGSGSRAGGGTGSGPGAGGPQVPAGSPPGSYGPYGTPAPRGEAGPRRDGARQDDGGRERRGLWGAAWASRDAAPGDQGRGKGEGAREGTRDGGPRGGTGAGGERAGGERGGASTGGSRWAGAGSGRTMRRVPGPRRDDSGADWWRLDRVPGSGPRAGEEIAGLPGMTGGVFIPIDDEGLDEDLDGDLDSPLGGPRLRKRPQGRRPAGGTGDAGVAGDGGAEPGAAGAAGADGAQGVGAGDAAGAAGAGRAPRRLLPGLGRLGRGWGGPSLLLAAGLLLAGAAMGSLIPLGLGWAVAYLSRRLSRAQAKFAVLGIPGTAAAAMIVWVWGRDAGKWGAPIAQGHMGQAFQDAYPGTIRLAALASALYLLWRSRRTP